MTKGKKNKKEKQGNESKEETEERRGELKGLKLRKENSKVRKMKLGNKGIDEKGRKNMKKM